jgi:hypothetical protein
MRRHHVHLKKVSLKTRPIYQMSDVRYQMVTTCTTSPNWPQLKDLDLKVSGLCNFGAERSWLLKLVFAPNDMTNKTGTSAAKR